MKGKNTQSRTILPYEIYICDLGDPKGSMQGGIRPCIIISNKIACEVSPILHVIPITTKDKKYIKTHYYLSKLDYMSILDESGTALCENVIPINKFQIHSHIGSVREEDRRGIYQALINVFHQYDIKLL